MRFVHLTDVDGRLVSIDDRDIEKLSQPVPGQYSPEAKTLVLMVSGHTQAVRETTEEIERKLSEGGIREDV